MILPDFCAAHRRQHRTATEKQASQIHRHEPIPFFRVDGFDTAAVHRHDREDRGVVDQYVDSAEPFERLLRPYLWSDFSSATSM